MTTDLKASITIKTRLVDVTDTKSSRYAMGHVEAIPGEPADGGVWLTASDGRVAAIVPAAGFCRERTLIPHAVLPDRKKDFGRDGATVSLNGQWQAVPEEQFKRHDSTAMRTAEPVDGRFPAVGDFLHTGPADAVLAIDARLLAKLAEAINGNTGQVTLLLTRDDDGAVTTAVRVLAALRKMGFRRETMSGNSAYYYHVRAGLTVRVSDHEVPMTDEREWNMSAGGRTWANSRFSLVIGEGDDEAWLDEVRAEVAARIEM